MGTTCALVAVVPYGERGRAEKALCQAETALRAVEARMSTWMADSEVSCFNAAGGGVEVPLSPETLEVLRIARDSASQTHGAFDVTCGPVIELWRRAGERGVAPTETELADARAASGWGLIELTERGGVKRCDTARVDLGGVAKGYAIDQAVEALRHGGLDGGLVDVGGDLACFGQQADGQSWPVDVRNPFGSGRLAQLRVRDAAVATSGNYARYTDIAGKRYSHIVDPRTGQPTEATQSATVVAPTALTADIWATALSVMGAQGLSRLPGDVEALMITGSKDDYRLFCTPGFRDLIAEPMPDRLAVWEADEK